MMYRYLTLNDGTEVVHSDVLSDGRVKVFFERPDEQDGFHDATCYLPYYTWENVTGFSAEDMERNEQLLSEVAYIIIELAQEGAFDYASGFLGSVHTSYTSGRMKVIR